MRVSFRMNVLRLGIYWTGDKMRKITIYKYDTEELRKLLHETQMTFRMISSLSDIQPTEWIFVCERSLILESEKIFALGYPVVVICKSVTQRKVKMFFEMGVTDYLLEPFIKEELIKRIHHYELEASANELDKRMKLAVDVAEIGVWDYEILSNELLWEAYMYEIHGLSGDKTVYELVQWEALIDQRDRDAFSKAFQHKSSIDIVYRVQENQRYIRLCGLIVDNLERRKRLIGTCIDVTDHIKIQDENLKLEEKYLKKNNELEDILSTLQKTKNRLDLTLKVADIGYWEWYVDKNYSYENEQWFSMLGYDKEKFQLNDEWFYGLMHPSDLPEMVQHLELVAKGMTHTINKEFRLKNKDGNWTWILARGQIIEYMDNGEAKTVSGVHIDVSNLKASEKQRKILSEAVTMSPVGIVLTDIDGNIEYMNPAYEQITGYDLEDVTGKNMSIFNSGYHDKGFYKEFWNTIKSGKEWKGVFLNKNKHKALYWESLFVSPMFDHALNITSFLAIIEDITKQKERENEIVERNKRLTRQQWILQSLTQSKELTESEMESSLFPILESVVSGLEVTACSLWFFEDINTRLSCLERYSMLEDDEDEGSIQKVDFREYFEALQSGSQITIASIDSTEYTAIASYFLDRNVHASIHIPIWLRGEVIGVVIAEHEFDVREWWADEISFLRSISDFLTISLETRERLKAQQSAEDASKAKSDFLANMSHEIRTPMNAVIGLSHLVLQTSLSEKQEDYVRKINNSAKHLLVLINDILDFSKVEAGKVDLEHIAFNLDAVLNNLEDMIQEKINEKNLTFTTKVVDNVPRHLIGDPYRLGQILINLASNAVKFTDDGGIDVFVERVYSDLNTDNYMMLRFSVKDTGIGIESNVIEKLFDSFEQGDASITRQYGGTGLGLSICQKLVQLFGGEITVESEWGVGSVFIFTANFEIADDNEHAHVVYPAIDTTTVHQSTILIAEDNDINQEIICELLRNKGLTCHSVNNGLEAIEYLERGEPCGMILMDLQMPVMDGFASTKHIRKNRLYQHIPIVAISADARPEVKIQAMNDGMNDFIIKPIDQEEMMGTVFKWLNMAPFELKIKNVDTDLGLKHCNGNEALYIKILTKFAYKHHNDMLLVKKAIEARSGEEENILHTLKSITGHIGSLYMAKEIEAIEDFVNNRKRGYKKKLEILTEQMHLMVDDIRQGLVDYQPVQSEKKRDDDQLCEWLIQLKEPLKAGRINDVSIIMEKLLSYKVSDELREDFEMLCKQIKKYQYDLAGQNLSLLMKKMEVCDE